MEIWFGRREADDVDRERGEVGYDTVQVRGVTDRSGQPGGASVGGFHLEVVSKGAEQSFAGVASDDDLVGDRFVHVATVFDTGVMCLRPWPDLTRVRSVPPTVRRRIGFVHAGGQ